MLLKEPLLHFVVLGALIFIAYSFVGSDGPADDEIVVTRGQQERLAAAFQSTWRRMPKQQELDALIDNWIREEIAFRQAIDMGLDENDTILRRRLRQKFELIAEDIVGIDEPTADELNQFLSANSTDYALEATYSLRQVFFSADARGDAAQQDAEQALLLLQTGAGLTDPEGLGDVTSLPYRLTETSRTGVASRFGQDFTAALQAIEPGRWQGPVRSGYGLHLVIIDEYLPSRAQTLEEVERSVRRDWHAHQKATAIDRLYERLRAQYRIRVEGPERPGPSSS